METHIPLIVRNVDLDDDETLEQLAINLADFGWQETGGQVVATFFTESSDPVAAAAAAALCIRRVLPQASVERVDEQFVSLADIAARAGLSHEAVRLWAAGKRRTTGAPFPAPRAEVGQGRTATKIWTWPEVLVWLEAHYCLDLEPDTAYLTVRQVTQLNALLQEPRKENRRGRWQPVATAGVTRTLGMVDAALEEGVAPGPTVVRYAVPTGRR
ncbi:hypothetical protein SAMN05216483_3774 [Streptomyces sp. 2131.1]|uniref:hypothetical protein n=1 Tax=Streptomyces sp. 2131.1 TaxID=1855346 RepID=UPI00089D40CD|nr:hypothetical protein [Streptomyces sp. 2131.1]SED40676.1 hypothetical protein SAMN05216483_3774 [Streptomyces sp. 2131.1]